MKNEEIKEELPVNVVNPESYKKYLALHKKIENDPNRYYKTSDPMLILDLYSSSTILERQISHLPLKEQDAIMLENGKCKETLRLLVNLKRLAFVEFKQDLSVEKYDILVMRQAELLEYFGRFFKPSEIHRIIIQEWGYDIPLSSLMKFYKDNLDRISEKREDFKKTYDDVRLTHRKSRLLELEHLFLIRKQKYVQTENIADEKQLQAILESIKREVDGDLVIKNKTTIEIEQTINVQVRQEMLKEFNITALIVSRISGRLNINPLLILSRLTNSKYAKFTGFVEADNKMEEEIPYFSTVDYDMEKIRKLNRDILNKDETISSLPVLQNKDEDTIVSIKQKLIDEILRKKGLLQEAQRNLK